MNGSTIRHYRVWDVPTRVFHWVNFLAVLSLIFVGLLMMYKKELGITGVPAKVGLKELHVSIGYVFVINLLLRLVWGFVGNRYARWRRILPGRGFGTQLRSYWGSVKAGQPQTWLGHNPLGRLAVTAMLLLMLVLAVSGLIRAGTDIYFPPFGGLVTEHVAADGVDPASLKPYDSTGTSPERMAELKAFKGPFGEVHQYAAYMLMTLIIIHILFVVRAEIKEGDGLVSAMINGSKRITSQPVDDPEDRNAR